MNQSSLEKTIHNTERVYVRVGLKVATALVLLVLAIWGGRVVFLRLQETRLMRQARASFEKSDVRWAVIAARRVFELNPANADACRLLAQIAEREGSNAAVQWRELVVAHHPESDLYAIELAQSALRFDQIAVAERALARLGPSGKARADYQDAAARIALAKNDYAAAEAHFAEAERIEPENKRHQLDLAVVQLKSPSRETRGKATAKLKTLLQDEQLRLPAARALRAHALEERDPAALLEASEFIYHCPEAELSDRIAHVQLLHRLDHPDFAARLAQLQEEAAQSPGKLYEVLRWMSADNLAVLALDWAKRLPAQVVAQPSTALAIANCYCAVKDWNGLQQWCGEGNWADLDFFRHAYLSRAQREHGDDLESRREWKEVLKSIGSEANKAAALQQEVMKWDWPNESADLLWVVARDPARQEAAFSALYRYYAERGLTSDLYRLLARLLELRPDDEVIQNNFAQASLLLNLDTARAVSIAERLYARDPRNPAFASTYAYSLFLKDKLAQALEIMNSLSPETLRQPSIAAYYGIFLAAAGEKQKAAEYLGLAANATLLPEEKAAVEKARRALR